MEVPTIVFNKWRSPLEVEEALKKKEVRTLKEQEVIDLLDKMDKPDLVAVVNTGSSIFIVDEHNDPSKNYNMWDFHANFELTPNILKIIGEYEGVEVLKCFTRYRGWLGVGQLFNEKTIFKGINERIREYFYANGTYLLKGEDAARKVLNNVLDNYNCEYTLYKSDTGELFPVAATNKEELNNLLGSLHDKKQQANQ